VQQDQDPVLPQRRPLGGLGVALGELAMGAGRAAVHAARSAPGVRPVAPRLGRTLDLGELVQQLLVHLGVVGPHGVRGPAGARDLAGLGLGQLLDPVL